MIRRRSAGRRSAGYHSAGYRTGARLAPAVIIPAVAVALLAAAMPPPAPAAPAWMLKLAIHYLPPATSHSQYDVVLIEPGQEWFLGGSDVGGHGRPVAERIVNGIPQAVTLPGGPHSWITAASAISPHDIWAVTSLGGAVLTWNGSAWTVAPRGAWQAGSRFTGIIAVSPVNVWLFGTRGRLHPGAGTWHWSGTAWARVGGVAGGLSQASEAAPGDLWAIGQASGTMDVLAHSAGTTWHRDRPAALAGFTYSRVAALAPHDVWVAGSVAGTPELGHFDGRAWTAVSMPGNVAATGICRDGNGGLWVIANTGKSPSRVLHRSPSGTWSRASVSPSAADELLACGLVPGTTVTWAAGKAAAPQGSAAAAYRHG